MLDAVNVPVVAPAATATDAGTLNAEIFDERATSAPVAGAAFERVTWQEALLEAGTLAGVHTTFAGRGRVVRVIVDLAEEAARDAVTAPVWSAENDPAVTVKLPLLEPAGIVIAAGAVSAVNVDAIDTEAPPDAAAPLRLTVQDAAPPGARAAGVQESEVTVAGAGAETVSDPGAPEKAIEAPAAEAAATLVTPIEALVAVGASVRLATATTPLAIGVAFIPDRMQE